MAPSWSPSPLLSLATHTHTHSEEGDGKRDSGGFTPPHNTIKWWLVGVAGVQAKWMMSAKKGGRPHTKWMNHSTQNTTLPNQSPFHHSLIPCPHTPIHVPSAPHTGPHQMPPPLLQPPTKEEGRRRTDGGTKEQVDTTTKARQHNGHLHGWLGVEPSATTHGHHNQHHHTSTAKACGSPPTPTQPHNSHQPWSPHSTTTMVWSSCLVCVSQMASDWHHGHTLATSNNTPPMPHPHRQRERGVDGARKTVEG